VYAIRRDMDQANRSNYTNTWAMRTWILCALGEVLNDSEISRLGKESL